MEVAKVTIKLLRADGQGHMLRIWNTYSADVSGYRCMNPSQFAALLSDLAGSTSSSVNATPMFEVGANTTTALPNADGHLFDRILSRFGCPAFSLYPFIVRTKIAIEQWHALLCTGAN